jgi:hypothetical protein
MIIKMKTIPLSKDSKTYATDVLKNLRVNLFNTSNIQALKKELDMINDLKLGDELEVTFELTVQKKKKR